MEDIAELVLDDLIELVATKEVSPEQCDELTEKANELMHSLRRLINERRSDELSESEF